MKLEPKLDELIKAVVSDTETAKEGPGKCFKPEPVEATRMDAH